MENSMMENMGSMMQLMGELNNDGDFDEKSSELSKYFVDDYNHSAINGIKACLPFMDFKYQKNLTIFLKLIEMQRIIDIYKERSKISIDTKKNQTSSMLKAIKPYLKSDKATMVDNMLKIMAMKEMMEVGKNKEA